MRLRSRQVARLHVELVPEIDRLLARCRCRGSWRPTDQNSWLVRLREACCRSQHPGGQAHRVGRESARANAGEFTEIDYAFLYDQARNLLSIGYNLDQRSRDGSFYDLLASEARLCSFVGIAQDRLPQEHWFALGRLLTTTGGRQVLLSWSGSMFEYLMPMLVMPTYPGDAAGRNLPGRGRPADPIWPAAGRSLGHFRVGLQRHRRESELSISGLRRPRPGFQAGAGRGPGRRPLCHAAGLAGRPARSLREFAAAGRRRLLGPLRIFRGDRLHSRARPRRSGLRHRPFVHGPSSGDEPAGRWPRGCSIGRCSAASKPMPIIRASDLLLQEKIPQAAPFYPHSAEVLSSGRDRRRPRSADAGVPDAPYPSSRSPSAFQRPLPCDGHRRRRRLQPLERDRADPLGRGCHARSPRVVLLSARHHQRRRLVEHLSADAPQGRRLRSHLHAGPGGIPSPRFWHRPAHRHRRLAGGRRRSPAADDHQPFAQSSARWN